MLMSVSRRIPIIEQALFRQGGRFFMKSLGWVLLLLAVFAIRPEASHASNDFSGYVEGSSPVTGGWVIVSSWDCTGYHGACSTWVQSPKPGISQQGTPPYAWFIFPWGNVTFSGTDVGNGSYGIISTSTNPADLTVSRAPVSCGDVNDAIVPLYDYVRPDNGQTMNEVYDGQLTYPTYSWSLYVWTKGIAYGCVKTDTHGLS